MSRMLETSAAMRATDMSADRDSMAGAGAGADPSTLLRQLPLPPTAAKPAEDRRLRRCLLLPPPPRPLLLVLVLATSTTLMWA